MNIAQSNLLLCIDFETAVSSRKILEKNLTINELRNLDNGETPETLETILDILDRHKQTITFFVVFKLEKIYPGIIRKIISRGHEVAWHGYSHSFLTDERILKNELDESYNLLKKYKILGFQAPNLTFFREGYPLLKKYGFRYSSSIYGNSSTVYNMDGILEIPVSVSNHSYNPIKKDLSYPVNLTIPNLIKFGIPFGSSYFWSLLGKNYYAKKIDTSINNHETVNLFTHNWQLSASNESKKLKTDERIGPIINPLFYPYKVNVMDMFEFLLNKYKFTRCIDFIRRMDKT